MEFAEAGDASDALANMDDAELFGRSLKVHLARPQQNKKKAVWEEAEGWFKALKAQGEDGDAEEAAGTTGS